MIETLLHTKLFIPVTRSSLVPRSQLIAWLNPGIDGRLALVPAPAGFGKTSLIVQWIRQMAESDIGKFSWLSLDENNNDWAVFSLISSPRCRKLTVV